MADLITGSDIDVTIAAIIGLRAKGISRDAFVLHLGIDSDELHQMAVDAAQEEFDLLPGMPPGIDATGRLRKLGLSANQRKVVKEALTEQFEIAFLAAFALARAIDVEEAPGG